MVGRSILLLLTLLQVSVACEQNKPVRLVSANQRDCDNTYDPYHLIDRITQLETVNDYTTITVNFSDNCCVEFNPIITFKDNKLYLEPYKESNGACDCNCCFSIEYKIEGLVGKTYETYFKGKKIERSDDPYKVFQPTSEEYKGRIINRTNRYGFKEGLWMTFYEDGAIKLLQQYPENVMSYRQETIWRKLFFRSGKLQGYYAKDTTTFWFEDGQKKFEHIEYKVGDTTYIREQRLHDNRRLKERSFEKDYPTIFKSNYDSTYEATGSRRQYFYHEEYFENGQIQYRYGRDSTYTWYPSGKVESVSYVDGEITYDENHHVTKKTFQWNAKGPASMGDLDNQLHIEYNGNGKVLAIEYVRDEAMPDYISSGVRYNWKWNNEGTLLEAPKHWKEQLPWKRFSELKVP